MRISFLGLRSLYRTDAGAGAALDARIGIDLILAVAFLNAADGTFVRASSASERFITTIFMARTAADSASAAAEQMSATVMDILP